MNALRSVFWKEWIGLRPFALLLGILFVFGLFMTQVTEMFDTPDSESGGSHVDGAIMMTILTIIVSIGLVVREKNDGTLLYLDGLPVRRELVYFAKTAIALGLVTALTLIWTVEALIYDFAMNDSLSPPIDWSSELIIFSLTVAVCAVFLAVMMPLSFLGRWAFLVLGGLLWLVIWLKSSGVPYATWLDPYELFSGQGGEDGEGAWFWPTKQLAVLGAFATVSWLLGLTIFVNRSSLAVEVSAGWWKKLIGVAGLFFILAIWIAAAVFGMQSVDEEESTPISLNEEQQIEIPQGENAIAEISTDRLTFIFREHSREAVTELAATGDDAFEKVATFLETPSDLVTDRIVVDLTSTLGSHNAGQAHWKKIRMTLPSEGGTPEATAILGHELTHVLIDQITRARISDDFNTTRWFHEGLASYVEHRFFREEEASRRALIPLAVASAWGEVDFAELVDNEELSKLRDPFIVYPAGSLWVDALVTIHGDDAPARLLRAVNREGAPRKLSGLTFWRDTCTAAGFDLERIRSQFRSKLAQLRTENEAMTESFPEITEATANRSSDRGIVVTPILPDEYPAGTKIVCRARPAIDAPIYRYRYGRLETGQTNDVTFSPIDFFNPEFQVQFGVVLPEMNSVFGEWITVKVE